MSIDQHLTARQLAEALEAAWGTGHQSAWDIALDDYRGYLVPALKRLAELNPMFKVNPLAD